MYKYFKRFSINNLLSVRLPQKFFAYNYIRHSSKMPRYEYPVVRRDETIVENFHGTEVNFKLFQLAKLIFYKN